jgi:hypothetical protein
MSFYILYFIVLLCHLIGFILHKAFYKLIPICYIF